MNLVIQLVAIIYTSVKEFPSINHIYYQNLIVTSFLIELIKHPLNPKLKNDLKYYFIE